MPEYLAPGVYVEEMSSGSKPIEGVSTSTAGFVGGTERGPLAPQFISSWLDYQRVYGGYIPAQSYLAYAVEGFFINGGQRCFIARVVSQNATRATAEIATVSDGKLKAMALGPGGWGDRVQIAVSKSNAAENAQNSDDPQADWVNVSVELKSANASQPAEFVESFENLTHTAGACNNLIRIINSSSKLIRVAWEDDAKVGALTIDQTVTLAGGNDGDGLTADDFVGHTNQNMEDSDLLGRGAGLAALALIDEISILAAPDEVTIGKGLTQKVIDQCEKLKDRFAIVSATQGQSSVDNLHPPADTRYGAFYYPWLKVFDPSINDHRLVPPSGHVAGIYAHTDIERGVHEAPANVAVRGVESLEFPVTKQMQDVLNPRGVNCFRDFRSDGRGIRLWGARTMSSDSEWRYVNVRRLFLFVEESIDEGTQWVVFEPNDDATWATLRRNLTNFLTNVWRSGALMGMSQDEAFFVRCDRTTMTQDDIDNGRLIAVIGIAPVRPAEFVIFRISKKTVEALA